MLNKAICIKCITQASGKERWDYLSRIEWFCGVVVCPYIYSRIGNGFTYPNNSPKTDTKEMPPKFCPFTLEHLVSQRGK